MLRAFAIRPSSLYLRMYLALVLVALVAAPLYALPSSLELGGHWCGDEAASPAIKNANHIFNAIHSSMRQWGSSLHHNGMSFFLADIPAGTELYHGRRDNVTVKGFDWLAFEPEHAMNFARQMRPLPPKDGKPLSDHQGNAREELISRHDDLSHADLTDRRRQRLLGGSDQVDVHDDKEKKPPQHGRPNDDWEMIPGWLHTYRMKHLRVVYVDGEAAAKSQKGTLDSQDYVLAPSTDREDPDKPGRGPPGDYRRAKQMCDMAADEWQRKVDGFIRMEHGFELILCDFEKSADLVRMARVSNGEVFNNRDGGITLLSFLKAIGARYHSIGGDRVKIDYDNFVTAFAADLDLFHGESDLPRLDNITVEQRTSLLASLRDLVLHDEPSTTPVNWQSIADMIIARYSDPLHSFAFDHFESKKALNYSLTLLLKPFIDYDARNISLEISRCATHFLPTFPHHSIAGTATLKVSYQICSTLLSTLNSTASVSTSQSHIANLVSWLSWTSWKECRPGCKYDEFCLTAIWPIGDQESHERPYCVNATDLGDAARRPGGGESYWNEMRPHPRGAPSGS
jgi:hypothetical protein